ncbi:MAG: VOC family protein [Acidobacteria bacterium]|nr:VOC family protein [Acidobacteriota bacterium]
MIKSVRTAMAFMLLVGILASVVPAFAQTAPFVGAVQIKRPNLVVSDMDRALRVYRDILAFKVFALDASGPESYSYPVFKFPKEAKLRMATLSTETGVRILALTEMKGAPLPPKPVPHRDAVVIEVKGIEQVMEKVKAEGLSIVPPKLSKTPEGLTFIEQAFEDHDGHLIVLYEIRAS